MKRSERIKANRRIRKEATRDERARSGRDIRDERARSGRDIRDERARSGRDIRDERAAGSRERNRHTDAGIATGVISILVIFAFLYLFVVTSAFATKPSLTKLDLTSPSNIGSGHVNWVLNEVGAYKLHSYLLFGELPVVEFVITDQNSKFTTTVTDNYPTTVMGAATNPDIRFSMNSADFMTLYATSDTLAKAREMVKSGLIKVDIVSKSEFALAVKGYKSIYDALSS
jgi:hypothetical protein